MLQAEIMSIKQLKAYTKNSIAGLFPLISKSIRNILVILKIKPIVGFVQIALTYNCNANCAKCSIKSYKKKEKELSTKEVKSIIDQLYNLGTRKIGFFGGEPLLRRDVTELVAYASSKKMETDVFTNGYLLSEEKIKKLKDAGLSRISIGLDSPDKRTHDKLRGINGCFEKALEGVKLSLNNNIRVVINTIATKKNVRNGDLKKIVLLGKELNVDEVHILLPSMIGGWLNAKKEILENSDYEKIIPLTKLKFVFSELVERNGKVYVSCYYKNSHKLYISCYGEVQPCWAVPLSFGNIREKPLKEIINLMNQYELSVNSDDCIINDKAFRERYASYLKSKANLPFKI
jgi:MoaA/NifB/PqqE/SkfB family radical SAM enzyme